MRPKGKSPFQKVEISYKELDTRSLVIGRDLMEKLILNAVDSSRWEACEDCGARFRFGDLDCPHCGAELDDYFRQWAMDLLEKLGVE